MGAKSVGGSWRSRLGITAGPTLRQYDVLAARVQHGCEKEAAAALGISRHTVQNHIYALRRLHDASTTAHLVALVFTRVGDIY